MKEPFVKERPLRDLRCVLSEEEIAERALEAANKVGEIAQLEDEKKASASDFKKQIEELDASVSLLSREVRERSTTRTVECQLWIYPDEDKAELIRTDTGEVLPGSRRELTREEKQGNLFPLRAAEVTA